jgi:DNA mismatch repair ATPase MutS
MIGIILTYFGVYRFTYQWVVSNFKKSTKESMAVYECIGYFELCIALSSYRKTLPYYCFPELSANNRQIKFAELYHPLLKQPVPNSKTIDQKFIITGANASGKSTFIKTLAINAITAQNINMCYAEEFHLQPALVYTAMNLSDDIIAGDSFYMAEIKRLKRFLDSLADDSYKMFFVDEILKGTNTRERIAAASAILRRFAGSNNFFCLATHDTELTSILKHYYANYHFEETTTETEIIYDYKLYDGVTPGSNAIALLRVMRYDSAIVDEALGAAERYLRNGEWFIHPENIS